MKTVALVSSMFFSVKADLNNIMDQMQTITKAKNITFGPPKSGSFQDMRAFVDPIKAMMEPIYDYGCWCVFAEDWVKAGGKPKDAIDERCKQLINGYRCARMDAKANGEECDAGNVAYTPYNFFAGATDMEAECITSNPGDTCAQTACFLEGDFTMHFLTDFITGNIGVLADPTLQTAQGFDRAVCLKGKNNDMGGNRECCGELPSRAPFSVTRGIQGCCGESIYSVMSQDCCADVNGDFVASIGSCP